MRIELLTFSAWLLLAMAMPSAAVRADGYRAGVGKIEITPAQPLRLSGYAARGTAFEAIDQPLFARALALEDPAGRVSVLVSVDAVGIAASMRERVCGAIRGPLGIYRPRVAIGATHSHSAPCLEDVIVNLAEYTPAERDQIRAYTEQVVAAAVQAVRRAVGSLEPVVLAHGVGTASFAANRRRAGGPVDHSLPVLRALTAGGEPLGIVFSYACHATTIPPERNRVCGDWPGYAAELLEEAHPGCVALPLIGCGGDANPQPRTSQADARRHGRELAVAVEAVLAGPLTTVDAELDAQFEYAALPYARLPSAEELRGRLETGRPEERRRARLLLDQLAREGSLPETYELPVQVWSFGDDLTMVFLGGEVVVDYALRLRRELGRARLWVSAYMNDIPGYIASRRVLSEGGYEADGSTVWYGRPSRWADSVEDVLVGRVKELVRASADPLARIKPAPPLSPRAAAASFRTLDGLVCELVACEPEVVDPVAIAFDAEARMFACEMRDYPLGLGAGKPAASRVRLLEDRDGDGRYETSTVFADRVPYANSVACWDGGVFVTCETEIIRLVDRDGDGQADERRAVFTGFRTGNSQHLLCSLEWGPDGWLHGLAGNGGSIRTPDFPDREPQPVGWSSFRFDPRDLQLEDTAASRGGFGVTFNRLGERMTVSNQMPVYHVVLEARYLGRNPRLEIPTHVLRAVEDRTIFPITPKLERFNDPFDDGRFSGACGTHAYEGVALGPGFDGDIFVCEPVSSLVYRGRVERRGATFAVRRADPGREFLASTDAWFRPVHCTTGPDGALYVVDMYREVIEHPEWIPEHIQKLFDLRAGVDRGRIWRLRRADLPRRAEGLAVDSSVDLLAGALDSKNPWRRQTARRLLIERARARDSIDSVARAVRHALASGATADGRALAIGVLEAVGRLDVSDLVRGASDRDPVVRRAAAIASESWFLSAGESAAGDGTEVERASAALIALAADSIDHVRFQAALSLGFAPVSARRDALTRIALADAADPWVRVAVLSSWAGELGALVRDALAATSLRGRMELVQDIARWVGARGEETEVRTVLDLLLGVGVAGGEQAVTVLLAALRPGRLERALAGGEAAERERIGSRLEELFARKASQAEDVSLPLPVRLDALRLLGYDRSPGALGRLEALVDARHPTDVQVAAARALALLGGAARDRVTELFLADLGALTPAVRDVVISICLGDVDRVVRLVGALEEGDVELRDLGLQTRRLLTEHPDESVRRRAKKLFAGRESESDRAAVVQRYQRAHAAPEFAAGADRARGRQVFVEVCSQCHRVDDEGALVGPELTGLATKTADQIIVDILDPNRVLEARFASYTIVTTDGQVFSGLMLGETPASLVLREAGGATHTVFREDALQVIRSGGSVMPDGLEEELTPEKMRDLVAFLLGGAFR